MNPTSTTETGLATMPTAACEIGDFIVDRLYKLDEHAREVISAIAKSNYDKRIEAGLCDPRLEDELKLQDWLEAEQIFCAALAKEIRQSTNGTQCNARAIDDLLFGTRTSDE